MGSAAPVDKLKIALHTRGMEAPKTISRSVHAVRHIFKPSEPLAESLSACIRSKPGSVAPRFLLSSTCVHLLDAGQVQQPALKAHLVAMRLAAEQNQEQLTLIEARHRYVGTGALKLAFIPNQAQFQQLTALPALLEPYRTVRQEPRTHFIGIVIEPLYLTDEHDREATLRALTKAIGSAASNSLYYAETAGLTEISTTVTFERREDVSEPTASSLAIPL